MKQQTGGAAAVKKAFALLLCLAMVLAAVPFAAAADAEGPDAPGNPGASGDANMPEGTLPDSGCIQGATVEDLTGKIAGVLTGTPQDDMVRSNVQDPELMYFSTFTDMALALQQGKIDYYVNSTISYRIMRDSYPEFGYIDAVLRSFAIGSVFPKTAEGGQLRDEFNEYIAAITENGTLEQLQDYWLNPNDWQNVEIPSGGPKGTVELAALSTVKPFSFRLNNDFAGFDIAVIAGFCREHGYGLHISDVDFAGALSGIASGKFDMAAGQISYTEERAKNVLYSDFYCRQEIVPIVRMADFSAGTSAAADKGSFLTSVRRTLLDENRWQMILRGLGVTLTITLFGFLLANLVGALFCAMAMSRSRLLRVLADIYSRVMQGTPVVVILMILFYAVFRSRQFSGVLVASIGFGITSGAYLAQLFEGAIRAVDRGQIEAALAIGLSRVQTFSGIVLPQAVRGMLPGWFSQLISLMKGTAVVGYIAVTDLTKAGDIIRSSTFEAFFPLLLVALIYLILASLLISIMKLLQKHLEPHRARTRAEGAEVLNND